MKKEKSRITQEMTFKQIVENYPGSADFLFKKGFHCIGCPMASMESIRDGAFAHGENPEKLIRELNKHLKID
jgi:hybrid cluster-associated redox disulfide protein